jgi:hypothetical protein
MSWLFDTLRVHPEIANFLKQNDGNMKPPQLHKHKTAPKC